VRPVYCRVDTTTCSTAASHKTPIDTAILTKSSGASVQVRTFLMFDVLASFTQRVQPCTMHPPAFHVAQRLSDWPDCALELRCPCSEHVVMRPVQMLLECGDQTFGTVLAALRCSKCDSNTRTF